VVILNPILINASSGKAHPLPSFSQKPAVIRMTTWDYLKNTQS
jgi:hypothetical protein